jgi:DNA-binding NarL/FixJ family response regulator
LSDEIVDGQGRALDQIRVMIVDDHRMVAESLEKSLSEDQAFKVVALAGTVAEALAKVEAAAPDVVLMDCGFPDGTGVQAAEAIRWRLPDTTIVFVAADASDEAMIAAVEVGARAYILKTQPLSDLTDAIRRTAAGEMLIPAEELPRLLRNRHTAFRAKAEQEALADRLTDREGQILKLMATGHDPSAVADYLCLELTTVRWHVKNILGKLGVHSQLAAVARAVEAGLVDISAATRPRGGTAGHL